MFFRIFFSALFVVSLGADMVEIKDFESDIYSKETKGLKKVALSLVADGKDLELGRYKFTDAMHVVVSSFYAEDLFTSQGKERFKSVLKQYCEKKYQMKVDEIYFQSFHVKENVSVDAFMNALKKEGFCKEKEPNTPKSTLDALENMAIDN